MDVSAQTNSPKVWASIYQKTGKSNQSEFQNFRNRVEIGSGLRYCIITFLKVTLLELGNLENNNFISHLISISCGVLLPAIPYIVMQNDFSP